jgi:hypothetical protein
VSGQWFVEVVALGEEHFAADTVVKRIGPVGSERQAERVERGVLINMSDRFFTRVVSGSERAAGLAR